jgi:hypothetical protein
MTLACVVCGAAIEGEGLYANTWERARQRYPCCSVGCCEAFNPDIHWLPAVSPEPAATDEQRRLLEVARARLEAGDNPSVITRELLLAGVAISALNKVLGHAGAASSSVQRDARLLTGFGLLTGLVSGMFRAPASRNRKLVSLDEALEDIEAWKQRWGPS